MKSEIRRIQMKKKRKLNIKKVITCYMIITVIGLNILNLLPDDINYTWCWFFGFSAIVCLFTGLIDEGGDE
jgi:hypothetical protein